MDEHLAFLQSQAAYVESEVFNIRYADIQYQRLVPVVTDANPYAGQITYYSHDGVGEAAFLANRGNDFPLVETQRSQYNVRVENLGIGYDYDMFELGQAMMLGQNLTTDKAEVARRVSEERIDQIVLNGQSDMGWDGLINNTNIPAADAATGASGDTEWEDKTPLEVLKDIQGALGDVWSDSLQVEMANTIALSPDRYLYLAHTPLGDNADHTILQFLRTENVWTAQTQTPLMITTIRQLATAGAGGTQRMMTYRNERQVLRLHMPMPLMFLEAQQMLQRYIVAGVFRLGGLEIRLPQACRYTDRI